MPWIPGLWVLQQRSVTEQSRRNCNLDLCSCNLDSCSCNLYSCFIVIIMLIFSTCYNICRVYVCVFPLGCFVTAIVHFCLYSLPTDQLLVQNLELWISVGQFLEQVILRKSETKKIQRIDKRINHQCVFLKWKPMIVWFWICLQRIETNDSFILKLLTESKTKQFFKNSKQLHLTLVWTMNLHVKFQIKDVIR